ncbi:MAG: hypothetical protein J07HQW2_00645 [Haloquadratum walsbyi J07HQW2]|jgi:hypothetical protein|uniref:Uncharacterized protein n=1 Tax=Haloquadratum walsbyi J07HQW2 TaxID=1238425 RepID=U1PPI1_9EURY|nr:MAG: hypothetical protein J07HQW2_00645 [Haloquadratum walsbyi J07HQW2]
MLGLVSVAGTPVVIDGQWIQFAVPIGIGVISLNLNCGQTAVREQSVSMQATNQLQ